MVADEIRKLAEESSSTVNTIQTTVEKVQSAFKNISESTIGVLTFIEENVIRDYDEFVKNGEQYEHDAVYVDEMSTGISTMSKGISHTVEEINLVIEKMNDKVNSSVNNTNDILSNIEGTVEGIENINYAAEGQAELAQKLNEIVNKFII